MIEHLNPVPTPPERVVVIGSNGFVGGALVRRLARERIPALAVGRAEVDLLAADATETLAALLRLDALASAGFGLSRSRMAERIRQGELAINWQTVTSPSRELASGDRVQWSGRGELHGDSHRRRGNPSSEHTVTR